MKIQTAARFAVSMNSEDEIQLHFDEEIHTLTLKQAEATATTLQAFVNHIRKKSQEVEI